MKLGELIVLGVTHGFVDKSEHGKTMKTNELVKESPMLLNTLKSIQKWLAVSANH